MGKIDKDFAARMWGMQSALVIVKDKGVEALEKEIFSRGAIKAPFCYTNTQLNQFWDALSKNLYNTMLTVMCLSIHDTFGFGQKRLRRLKAEFDKNTRNAVDLSWIGKHYVTLEDYAVYLNEQYDLGINVELVAACQDSHDAGRDEPKVKLSKVIAELREHGFEEAAQYLEG